MLRNIVSLYLFFAVLTTSFFAAYVLSKGRSKYMKIFSALIFSLNLYLFGYLMELNSSSLDQMIFWNQIQYFGLPFFPMLWLMVALLYTNRDDFLKGWKLALLLFIPIMTFFLRITNPLHHLYYRSMEMQHITEFALLYLIKGPWYYVQNIYILFCLIMANIVFYWIYRKSSRSDQSRFRILLVATMLPFIGILLVLTDLTKLGLDYNAFLLSISLFLIMFAIFKYDFLEIKALARETIFENNSDGMLLLDKELRIMDYNKAAQNFFSSLDISLRNYPIEEILGQHHELVDILKSETSREFQIMKDGQERFFEISSSMVRNVYERNVGMLKSIRDITEKKKMHEKLKILATIDALSGLNNREEFMQLAQQEFERSQRYSQVFSLLMMDIDCFKSINDTKGHGAGDAVIHEIGRMINSNIRKTDIAGRIGGEEFAVLLTNTSIDEAKLVADLFREKVAGTKVVYDRMDISLTISIGVAAFFRESKNIYEILKYADEALYRAKAVGKNCVK